jgi:hypothetical protein
MYMTDFLVTSQEHFTSSPVSVDGAGGVDLRLKSRLSLKTAGKRDRF